MAVVLATNWNITAPSPIDSRFGGSNTSPWTSIAQANTNIPSIYRYKGLTATIVSGGQAVDVWYQNGITDSDLIVKQYTASLTAGQLMSLAGDVVSFVGGAVTGGLLTIDVSSGNGFRFQVNDSATATLILKGNDLNVGSWANLRLHPETTGSSYIDFYHNSLYFRATSTAVAEIKQGGNALFYNNLGIGSNSTDPTSRLQVVETTGANSLIKFWNGTTNLLEMTANGRSTSFFNVPTITFTAGQIIYTTSQVLDWTNVGGSTTSFGQKVTITPTYPSITAVETGGFYEKQVVLGSAPSTGGIYYHPYNFQTDVFDLRAQIIAPSVDLYGSSTFLTMRSYAVGSAGVRDRFELRAGGSNGYSSWYTSNGVNHYSNVAMVFSIGNTATNIVPSTLTQNFTLSAKGLGAGISFAGSNATSIATQKSSGNFNFISSLWNTSGSPANNTGFFSMRSVASTSASMTTNLVMIASASATSDATAPATNSSFKFFDLKADLLNSVFAVGLGLGSAESPTAKVTIGASTSAQTSLNIIGGSDPSSPNAGDFWYNSSNTQFKGATNGTITNFVTTDLTNGFGGGEIVFGASGDTSLTTSSPNFKVDNFGSGDDNFLVNYTGNTFLPTNFDTQKFQIQSGLTIQSLVASGGLSYRAHLYLVPMDLETTGTKRGEIWFEFTEKNFYGITINAEITPVTQIMKFLTYYDSSGTGLSTTSGQSPSVAVFGQTFTNVTRYLAEPDLWIAINNDGTKYLIPCYQPS